MTRHLFFGFALVFAGLAAAGRADEPLKRFSFEEPHMGTLCRVVLYAADEAAAKKAARAAFDRIAELDHIMSDYKADSELMQLCKKAGGAPVKVSADLFAVLEKAQEIARRTDGAFDVTVGPIVRLWRRARRTRQLPSAEDIKLALAKVGYDKIRLDADRRTVQLLVMGMLLDLGGIAKGYAADAVLELLRRQGFRQALVALGGDIRVGAAPPGSKGWKIGVAPLKGRNAPPTHYVLLVNAGVSTAGDSEQFVEIGGTRYSHIVNPKTGMGLVGRRSATVIAPNDLTADAIDTALCVLGPERALKLVETLPDIAALYVFEDGSAIRTRASSRWQKFERENEPRP